MLNFEVNVVGGQKSFMFYETLDMEEDLSPHDNNIYA